ncbi:uncharacterized protein LOC144699765 isoform X2 [Cetorhinus maximus]
MVDRRIRKARFSSRDLCVLVDAVMERREDIFGRGGDPPDTQRRRDAWQYVTERVNAVSGTHRTWEEVRKKVHDLKKSTKEKLAYNRRSWQTAGAGPPDVKTLTEFENDMIVVFGKESLEGLRPVDIGTMPRHLPQREQSGQHVVSEEQHTPECQLSPILQGNNTEMPLVRGIKDENQETPNRSASDSQQQSKLSVLLTLKISGEKASNTNRNVTEKQQVNLYKAVHCSRYSRTIEKAFTFLELGKCL